MLRFKDITKGIRIRPVSSDPSDNIEGSIWALLSGKLKAYLGSSVREIVTTDQAQVLTNKTIDFNLNTVTDIDTTMFAPGVLDTDLSSVSLLDDTLPTAKATKDAIDAHALDTSTHGISSTIVGTTETQSLTNKTIDANLNTLQNISATAFDPTLIDIDLSSVSLLNDTVPSAYAAKTYTDDTVDAHATLITGAHASSAISYDNTISGLVAVNVKTALDEIDGNLDTHMSDTSTHGITSTIVGISESQILTNKTIVAANNTISGLLHGTHVDNPSSGVHGVVGSVVGTTDTQILTNKTLTAPTISGILTAASYVQVEGSSSLFQSQVNSTFGLSLSAYKSARILGYVSINATSPLFETLDLLIVKRSSDYKLSQSSVGDVTGITFDINGAGSIIYSSGAYAGFVSATLQYQIVALY